MNLVPGITVGKPLISLEGGKKVEKSVQENGGDKKIATESTRSHGSSSGGKNDDVVLKDNMYNASSFVSTDGGNEDDENFDLNNDEEDLSPSALTGKLYGILENQEAIMSGFHTEKDPSGSEIGPMAQAIANNNDTFVYKNKGQGASSAGDEEQPSLGREEKLKQLLSDPLAKVSYVLNQDEVNPHNFLQTSPNKENTAKTADDTSTAIGTSVPASQTESDLHEVKMTSSNISNDPGSVTKGGSISLQKPNGVNPLLNKTFKSTKTPPEINHESLNQSAPSEEGLVNSLVNSPQVLNTQLPELVESVVERLGNKGSKFVSVALAKHPKIKNVWANVIAQALIKESDKISQLDSERKSQNISSIETDSRRITASLNDLSNVNVQAGTKTKPTDTSLVLNQMKEPANAVKERLKESKTKPSIGSADGSQTEDPALTMEARLKAESETKSNNGSIDSSLPLNQMKEPIGVINRTSTHPVLNSKSEPSIHGDVKVMSLNDSVSGIKVSGKIHRPINQIANKDLKFQGKVSNWPSFVSKSVQRLGGGHNIKSSEKQDFGNKPMLTPIVSGFISNNEITTQLQGSRTEEQIFGDKPIFTPIANGFVSNIKESTTRLAEVQDEQKFRNKPNSAPPINGIVSATNPDREIDAPFLYNNITRLDPEETRYLQLNLMSDPVSKEGFSNSDGPYSSQQQLQDEDAEEASYLEHQINDADHIVGEILPSLNTTLSKEGNSEASFVSGQVLGDPFAKAELAESFARDNNLINAENGENAQIMASVINEDKPTSNQQQSTQQSIHHDAPHSPASEKAANARSPSASYINDLSYRDATKMQSDVRQMLLGPETVSDISAVDLAPISNLEGFQGAFNLNKPKTFMYQSQNEGNDRTEFITGGSEANDVAQYSVNPLLPPATMARPQKKQLIHIRKRKNRKKRHRKSIANVSSTPRVPSYPASPPRLKYFKTSSKHVALRIKPTKSRDQPGTRESEISPTSVIFGLTTDEMKEIEKHLAHRPHALGGIEKSGNLQGASPATKGYYNTKTDEEQEKSHDSIANLVNKILKQRKNKGTTSRRAHTVSHKRKHVKLSLDRFSPKFRKSNKVNNGITKVKRDLESWESSTDVLNSDLDQIRGLSPKAQEDISNVIMKDYDGQQRHVKGIESFPFDERDPSYAFERSLKDQPGVKQTETIRDSNDSKWHSRGQRRLDIKDVIRQKDRNVETGIKDERHKKSEFFHGDEFNDTEVNGPLVMKSNKLLNGDVIPLDDVRNVLAQGLILETLRKQSEGDLQYADSVQTHDLNRMKNMFQSAGDEIGIKRNSKGNSKTTKGRHSKLNKFAGKRDISDWTTESNDGTFRSPDFEKQLSNALKQESEHDLTYMDTVQNLDEQEFKTMRHHDDLIGSREAISQNALHYGGETESTDSGPKESLENTQEKLRVFLHNSHSNDEGGADEKQQRDGKGQWTTSAIQGSVFRDLTPEGKVLSSDYKDLGNFGSDAQAQLASVLQTANTGDQRDLNELEKIDSDDQKDIESIFKPSTETFKRSIAEKPAVKKEGTIETIADVSDPGTKEKEINIVVSGDEGKKRQTTDSNDFTSFGFNASTEGTYHSKRG